MDPADFSDWSFDGSSTGQAEGNNSDCILRCVPLAAVCALITKTARSRDALHSLRSDLKRLHCEYCTAAAVPVPQGPSRLRSVDGASLP